MDANNATLAHPLQIVGWASVADHPVTHQSGRRAVMWTATPGGSFVVTDLGPPGARNEAGQGLLLNSRATAINDSGQIAGDVEFGYRSYGTSDPFQPTDLASHAVAWMPSPAPGVPVGAGTPAFPVAPAPPNVTYVPVPLDTSTTNVDPDLGQVNSPLATNPVSSYAFGINNAGQIVGSSGDRAVVWSRSNPAAPYTGTQLPELGIGNQALAINNNGQIVGLLRTGGLLAPYLAAYGWPGTSVSGDGGRGTSVPVVWTPSSTDGRYGPPIPAEVGPDAPYGEARGINTEGQIVGDVHHLYGECCYQSTVDYLPLGFDAVLWQQTPIPTPPPTGSGPPPTPIPGDPGLLGNDGGALSTSSSRSQPHLRVPPVTGLPTSQSAISPPSPLVGQASRAMPAAGIDLAAGSRTGPKPDSDGTGSFPFSADTFLAMLTAMVLVPTGLLALVWLGWHRGWIAAARRRLPGIRAPHRVRESSW